MAATKGAVPADAVPATQQLSPTSMADIIAKLADEEEARADAEDNAMEAWEEAQWQQQLQEEEDIAIAQADLIARAIEQTYQGDDSQVVVTPEMRSAMVFMANATPAELEALRKQEEALDAQEGAAAAAAAADAVAAATGDAPDQSQEGAAPLPVVSEEEEGEEDLEDLDLNPEDRYHAEPSPRRQHGPLFPVPISDDVTAAAEAMFTGLASVVIDDEEQEMGEEEYYAEEERLYQEEVQHQQAEAEALMRHVEAEEDEGQQQQGGEEEEDELQYSDTEAEAAAPGQGKPVAAAAVAASPETAPSSPQNVTV